MTPKSDKWHVFYAIYENQVFARYSFRAIFLGCNIFHAIFRKLN